MACIRSSGKLLVMLNQIRMGKSGWSSLVSLSVVPDKVVTYWPYIPLLENTKVQITRGILKWKPREKKGAVKGKKVGKK